MCVLFVTAIRIKDLLFLKVYQLQPLITEYSILIEDFKQNTNSYKAVLTEKSKKIIQIRKKNFIALFYKKTPNSYVFTFDSYLNFTKVSDCTKILQRETTTRNINKVIKDILYNLPGHLFINSPNFRSGCIDKLWQDHNVIKITFNKS